MSREQNPRASSHSNQPPLFTTPLVTLDLSSLAYINYTYPDKMSCPECFSGHVNPGTPLGSIESMYGRRTYVALPQDGKDPLGVVVIIPDAFGLPFINNQILADHYASAEQYLVYLPDFMDGKASICCTAYMSNTHGKMVAQLRYG